MDVVRDHNEYHEWPIHIHVPAEVPLKLCNATSPLITGEIYEIFRDVNEYVSLKVKRLILLTMMRSHSSPRANP
jgi:hypothetical protein